MTWCVFVGSLLDWSVDWLIDWLVGLFIHWLVGWMMVGDGLVRRVRPTGASILKCDRVVSLHRAAVSAKLFILLRVCISVCLWTHTQTQTQAQAQTYTRTHRYNHIYRNTAHNTSQYVFTFYTFLRAYASQGKVEKEGALLLVVGAMLGGDVEAMLASFEGMAQNSQNVL